MNSNVYASDFWTFFSSSDSSILWCFAPFETEWKHPLFSIGEYIENVTSLVPGTHWCSLTVLCKHGGKVRKLGVQQEQQTLITMLSTALPPGDSKSSNSGFSEEWEWYLFSLMKPLKAYIIFLISWDLLLVQKSAMLPSYIFLTFTSPTSLSMLLFVYSPNMACLPREIFFNARGILCPYFSSFPILREYMKHGAQTQHCSAESLAKRWYRVQMI